MTILKKCWWRGIEVFLFYGELNAHRMDNKPLTDTDRLFIRTNKLIIIEEIRSPSTGKRISGEEFFKPFLEDCQKSGKHIGTHHKQ